MEFFNSLQAEWIKTKRSASNWLSLVGGLFIPTIMTIVAFYYGKTINETPEYAWEGLYKNSWQDMAVFLLPMGMILAGSLITQIESKNNTWKQVHTTPTRFSTIFFSKFTVILLMTVKFFIYFNIGVILSAVVPSLILEGIMPKASFPFWYILKLNLKIFIACMPILAFQYLLSLNFKNFLVPIGVGFLGLIGTLIPYMSVKLIYLSPFSFTLYQVLPKETTFNPNWYAFISFLVITAISYWLYLRKQDKG
jgi:hypothetical protein